MNRRAKKSFFAALFISVWAFWACAQTLPESRVGRVIDGDTFVLQSGEVIRLIGVDTPEYQPWKNHVQHFGREARDFSVQLLKGHAVRLEKDVEPLDKYGRTLAYVYLEDGSFVNLLLVQEGFARAKSFPPNDRYRELFKNAQQRARRSKKGLWAKP